jgi:hypothetical protein
MAGSKSIGDALRRLDSAAAAAESFLQIFSQINQADLGQWAHIVSVSCYLADSVAHAREGLEVALGENISFCPELIVEVSSGS